MRTERTVHFHQFLLSRIFILVCPESFIIVEDLRLGFIVLKLFVRLCGVANVVTKPREPVSAKDTIKNFESQG
jgi:hypothetical protein